jgi:hypothetical protein
MSDEGLLQRFTYAISLTTRGNGRATIDSWLAGFASGSGDVLILIAPTPGHKIVEVAYRTGNFPGLA